MRTTRAALRLSSAIKLLLLGGCLILSSCMEKKAVNAEFILGNPDYPAIAYGGYRYNDRSNAPSLDDIKEDLKLLDAMGIRVLRTYHARLYDHAPNLLQAIKETKAENPDFEMYVMLGVWMQCEGAWGDSPNHNRPDTVENDAEIKKAIELANAYPDIVKVIAVGNESMVHWAAGYFVHPRIILKEVNYLQELKAQGALPKDLWITSSDNFASWGGAEEVYHLEALDSLIAAVDYVSVHSYPFHDTHYNPDWWWLPQEEDSLNKATQIERAIARAINRVEMQVDSVQAYIESLGLKKAIHIGETGWASLDNHLYGQEQSGAADEYKMMLYHQAIRKFCADRGMACFYFEAFDEPWKDGNNPDGSENHFGLFTVDGAAKMPLWELVDQGAFEGLERFGKPIRKTLEGDAERALEMAGLPPMQSIQAALLKGGEDVLMMGGTAEERATMDIQSFLTLNPWEGSCGLEYHEGQFHLNTGTGDWWGASVDLKESVDLSAYADGFLEVEIKGTTNASFELGFLSGLYADGSQRSAALRFGPDQDFQIQAEEFQRFSLPIAKIKAETNLSDVRSPLYVKGISNFDGGAIQIRRIRYRKS